jgi:hypothetical protein
MENLTQEQIIAIKKYLTAVIALDKHLEKASIGYRPRFVDAVKRSKEELAKLFSQDEVDFLTSAAYRPELIAHFL